MLISDNDWLREGETAQRVVEASYRHSQKDSCLPGTRRDVLDYLYHGVRSDKRFIWLQGIPGTGRSTLAATIARELDEGGDSDVSLGGSFFFLRGDAGQADPRNVIPTLSHQFAQHNAWFRKGLPSNPERRRDARAGSIPSQLEELFVKPFQACKSLLPRIVFVLDALDECSDKHGRDLLRALVDASTFLPPSICFLITSRPETPLTAVFMSSTVSPMTSMRHLDNTGDDIEMFLCSKLLNETFEREHQWKPTEEQIRGIVTRAHGLFSYADTVVIALSAPGGRAWLQRLLHDTAGDAFRYPLHALYSLVLDGLVPPMITPGEKRYVVTLYHKFIGAMLCLQTPLILSHITAMMGLHADALWDYILHPLASVLTVHAGDNNTTVAFRHLSFQEFILSDSAKDSLPHFAFSSTDLVMINAHIALLSEPRDVHQLLEARYGSTCEWILEQDNFKKWKGDENSVYSIVGPGMCCVK